MRVQGLGIKGSKRWGSIEKRNMSGFGNEYRDIWD